MSNTSNTSQSIQIAISKSNGAKDLQKVSSIPHNTTESEPKIDFSHRVNDIEKANSDDISEMSAPISDVEPETTATALRTKTFSQR